MQSNRRCSRGSRLLALVWIAVRVVGADASSSADSSTATAAPLERCEAAAERCLASHYRLDELRAASRDVEATFACLAAPPDAEFIALPAFPDLQLRADAPASVFMAASHILSIDNDVHPEGFRSHSKQSRGRLIWELREAAGNRGQPRAQGQMAVAALYGLGPPAIASDAYLGAFRPPDTARAMALYYLAASANDSFAMQALGNRHRSGARVPKSCEAALLYLQPVAAKVVASTASHTFHADVPDHQLDAQLYFRPPTVSESDRVALYTALSHAHGGRAARVLGHLLSSGAGGAQHDPEAAVHYFRVAAQAGDREAMAQLGHMYAAGVHVDADLVAALDWFKRAAAVPVAPAGKDTGAAAGSKPSASGQFGLGFLYLHGIGVQQDYEKAELLLHAAGEAGVSDALFHLGMHFWHGAEGRPPKPQLAEILLRAAAKADHTLALYNLAMIDLRRGNATTPSKACESAAMMLATVGMDSPETLVFQLALQAHEAGRHDLALWRYLQAVELGVESASMNAAWLLNRGLLPPSQEGAELALLLARSVTSAHTAHSRSHAAAHIALAHAHFFGLGVPHDAQRAAEHYKAAADSAVSKRGNVVQQMSKLQGVFSLAWMHQTGVGLPQDLHLAKRYYDVLATIDAPVRYAVQMSRVVLQLHELWLSTPRLSEALATQLGPPLALVVDHAAHVLRAAVDPVYAFHNPGLPAYVRSLAATDPLSVAHSAAGSVEGGGSGATGGARWTDVGDASPAGGAADADAVGDKKVEGEGGRAQWEWPQVSLQAVLLWVAARLGGAQERLQEAFRQEEPLGEAGGDAGGDTEGGVQAGSWQVDSGAAGVVVALLCLVAARAAVRQWLDAVGGDGGDRGDAPVVDDAAAGQAARTVDRAAAGAAAAGGAQAGEGRPAEGFAAAAQ